MDNPDGSPPADRTSAGDFLFYMLAFVLGAGAYFTLSWMIVRYGYTIYASLPDVVTSTLMWLPLLIGMAVFQIVFGVLTGRWRGPRFWFRAFVFVFLTMMLIELPVAFDVYPSLFGQLLTLVLVFWMGLSVLRSPRA